MIVPIRVVHEHALLTVLRVAAPAVVSAGRGSECQLRLESDLVSRMHARFVLGALTFIVEDLSANGTGVGTALLRRERRELDYGSSVQIGSYQVTVGDAVLGDDVPWAPSEPSYHPAGASLADAARAVEGSYRTGGGNPVDAGHSGDNPHRPDGAYRVDGMYRPETPSSHAQTPLRPGAPAQRTETPSIRAVARRASEPAIVRRASEPAPVQRDARFDTVPLRRRIHLELLRNLDLAKIDATRADDASLRPRVLTALRRIVKDLDASIPKGISRDALIGELVEEALGLGPLEPLLADPTVTEIMVVDPTTIYVERAGRLELTDAVFTDDERVRAVVERIVTPLGRRIDESQPLVDARLKDGSRVNAVIRPLALRGTCITIRKFPKRRLTMEDLIGIGSLTPRMAVFLARCVIAKKNVLISGGTGSGKTTLLNVLSASIPEGERIVTIEDAAELQLNQNHVVSLETKAANMEGKGAFTIRELVRNALRMRPDRIVVGECRGGEALDMLQAMNTGHDGSLTTIHANSPDEALARLETLTLMAGLELPARAIREQIARCIHVVVQQSRISDGSRKITHVSEVAELDPGGTFEVRPIFEYERSGVGEGGAVTGEFQATGYLPSFCDELIVRGLVKRGERCI